MAGKIPEWESELWSYLSSGDGQHCPIYSQCRGRLTGGWCADADRERIKQLLYRERISPNSYNFLEYAAPCRMLRLVEMLAEKCLKIGMIRCPPVPTDLISLADEQHPVEVRLLPLKVYHGATWFLDGKWIIQLKGSDTPAARRYTLFHEAFHIFTHCKATPMFRARGIKEGYFNELLAERFAYCILLPDEWVKEKWAEVKNIDRMTKIFGVSKIVIRLRLKQLGLT